MLEAVVEDEDAVDRGLLRRWQDGDAAAGEELARRNYDRVRRFFEIKASFHADDLTQRTFLACVERAGTAQISSFRAYLFGIARNVYLMQQRGEGRRERAMEVLAGLATAGPTSVSTVVARQAQQQLLLRAMVELPADTLMVLQLFYWEGMRAREIGDVVGIPTSTVTSRLASARRSLREAVRATPGAAQSRDDVLANLDAWARSLVAPATMMPATTT